MFCIASVVGRNSAFERARMAGRIGMQDLEGRAELAKNERQL